MKIDKRPVILSEFGFELIRVILIFLLSWGIVLTIAVSYLFFVRIKEGL